MKFTHEEIIKDLAKYIPHLQERLVLQTDYKISGRKDYRYSLNPSLGLFNITLSDDSTGQIWIDDGHDIPFTRETYTYVRPLIARHIRTRIKTLEAQICYTDKDSSLVVQTSDGIMGDFWMILYHKGKEYVAGAYKNGDLHLGDVPLGVAPLYFKCIQEHFVPYVKAHIKPKSEKAR